MFIGNVTLHTPPIKCIPRLRVAFDTYVVYWKQQGSCTSVLCGFGDMGLGNIPHILSEYANSRVEFNEKRGGEVSWGMGHINQNVSPWGLLQPKVKGATGCISASMQKQPPPPKEYQMSRIHVKSNGYRYLLLRQAQTCRNPRTQRQVLHGAIG